MTGTVPETKDRPVFDEPTLAKLLEAAYVLQEHNRELQGVSRRVARSNSPAEREQPIAAGAAEAARGLKGDYAPILEQILETQHRIQASHLGLDDTLPLVAERVMEVARATGAAIGILDGGNVRYKAVFGRMTPVADAEIPGEKALCAACLRGQVIRCEDVDLEFLLDAEECQRRGIQSMIAVPVYQIGGIAGGLEVYYDGKRGFTEHDVHTCQLMAGLVTEALARGDKVTSKKSLASERSIMLEALEELKPELAALFDSSVVQTSGLKTTNAATAAPAPAFLCQKCGHELLPKEQFCGQCGSQRAGSDEPARHGDVASLWHTQEALKKNVTKAPANSSSAAEQSTDLDGGQPDFFEQEIPEQFAVPGLRIREAIFSTESSESAESAQLEAGAKAILAMPPETDNHADAGSADGTPTKSQPVADWSSAAAARTFLEQVAGQRPGAWTRFWNERRGDVYLAIAVILVACAIRWGIWSNHLVSATSGQSAVTAAHGSPAPQDDLSLFDRMLVKLGLAEAPEPLESKGNPEIQVWVDLKTALYYCPGTDLYGKTPKGRFTTQRDAQLDQFEPAYRKVCN